MLVRGAIEARLAEADRERPEAGRARLPRSLRSDRGGVRTALFQRLAASRLFALGDRAGVLKAAQGRSGRAFRLDVRQRVVVKALVAPHAHVLVRGRRADGRDLVIPRDYVAYGFRARAQEVAQERLGDLSRAEAERRVWRETEANRFTGFDRRLLAAAEDGLVDDGVGRSDAWAALTRGRLRHLERLGLAARAGRRYRLAADLEDRLRALQLKQDVIRTLNQRRLQESRTVRQLEDRPVRGRVVASGCHDELGAAPYVIVRDREGVEHYARLGFGRPPPEVGRQIELAPGPRGAQVLQPGRGRDLGL